MNNALIRWTRTIVVVIALASAPARGQMPVPDRPTASDSATPAVEHGGERKWAFSASAYTYLVPESREYVQPTITADRDWLHLEARYNYESLETGSAWVGYNFNGGDKLAWEFTPMLGGVFGNTTGVAPGYKGSLSWRKLELYSEGEYVIDTGDSSGSFFYNWSELTLAPVDWFRFGLVTQRTRAYQSERDVQRGLLAGFSRKKLDLTAYVFNPDKSRPTVVVAVGFHF
jgi:hypothetical protein